MTRSKRCIFWVLPRLGGCRLPCPEDVRRIAKSGVTLLVSLVEDYEYVCWPGGVREFIEAFEEEGVRVVRLPTEDFSAPDPGEACKILELAHREVSEGGKVVFHCYGGIGRTGTMLAAYLIVYEGLSLEEAVEEVGRFSAGPQSDSQWYFLYYLPLTCRSVKDRG